MVAAIWLVACPAWLAELDNCPEAALKEAALCGNLANRAAQAVQHILEGHFPIRPHWIGGDSLGQIPGRQALRHPGHAAQNSRSCA